MQTAMAFFKELFKAFQYLKYSRSAADLCLQFKWTDEDKLITWLMWVDNCVVRGYSQDLIIHVTVLCRSFGAIVLIHFILTMLTQT